MANILYFETAFLCCIILIMLLYGTKRVSDISHTKKEFITLLRFAIAFCAVDAIWGIFASHTLVLGVIGYELSTYSFHAFAAFGAFFCTRFAVKGVKGGKSFKSPYVIIAFCFMCTEFALLLVNPVFHNVFYIDSNIVYHPQYHRKAIFYLQLVNYMFIAIGSIRYLFKSSRVDAFRAKNVASFSVIIFLAGVLQLINPDMPMYSCGLIIGCLTVYILIISKEQDMIHAKELDYATEAATYDVYNALSGIYSIIYMCDLETGDAKLLKSAQNLKTELPAVFNLNKLKERLADSEIEQSQKVILNDFFDIEAFDYKLKDTDCFTREIKNAKLGWIRYNILAYTRDSSNHVTKVLWLVQEIDKAKKQELEMSAALESALSDAKTANEAKTNFLSRMSHDIRTPMNGIIGMTKIARDHIDDKDKIADCLNKISISSDHLLSLINDILELSRIESGKVVLSKDLVDLNDIADVCLSVMQSSIVGRNIKIDVVYSKIDNRYVYTDALRMRQIIMNIISNAVKYTLDGGSIMLNFDNKVIDESHLLAIVSVKDSGIGMSETFLKHIFEPFSQEDEHGARTKYKGTGLGMAIVKEMMDLFGGTVEIRSEQNVGTCVTLSFPLELAKEVLVEDEMMGEACAVNHAVLEGLNVLLVDDNELNREIAGELLSSFGMKITMACDGNEAVDIFSASEENEFGCILMDILMPNKDGYEATSEIRSMNRADARTVPILAMSANAFEEDIQKSKSFGMNDHLSKPIEIDSVVAAIKKYTRGGY